MVGQTPQYVRVTNSILQGDLFNTLLFSMTIAPIHQAIDQQCPETIAVSFIDDIMAVVPVLHISNYLSIVSNAANVIGLNMNRSKCKIIPLNLSMFKEIAHIDQVPIYKSGKFLGVIFSEFLDWEEDFQRRIKKAACALKETKALIRVYEA